MNKILGVIILGLLLSGSAFADSSNNYTGSKKGSMDFEIECFDDNAASSIYGYKNIDGKLFKYTLFNDENMYGSPESTVKIFKKKIQNNKVDLYMSSVPLPPEYEMGNGYLFTILISANNKWDEFGYFVKGNNSEMLLAWSDLHTIEGQNDDDKHHDWSEKALDIISKQLGFGEPFEIVDLEDINTDALIDGFAFQQKCKKL
ncbi:hypothetical protein N9T13_02075 [Candidatus Pelagibacter sp.]|nr:hypothetical protein [Candidatus Pelagibacter sp.]